jgi:hypothetical protein
MMSLAREIERMAAAWLEPCVLSAGDPDLTPFTGGTS